MTPGPNTLTQPTAADFQAIQSIYGTPAQAAEQDKSWSWNAETNTLAQVLNGGPQTVRGISTNNVITCGSGNDTVYAIGSGTNTITGGAGTDVLVGGSGKNLLIAGTGPDTFNGWFGKTTVSYQNAPAGVVANLANPSLNTGEATGDTYLHVIGLIGSKFADTLTADNKGETLTGLGGGDTLVGYSGGGDTFLDTATHLNGATIQNFAGKGDAIDITDLPFAGASLSFSGGVLTVTNGAKSAAITLSGTFTQSDFHMVALGKGVKITQTGGSLATFVAASAGLGGTGQAVAPQLAEGGFHLTAAVALAARP